MNANTKEAWAFVTKNLSTIRRVCQKPARTRQYIDLNDLVQQVCLLVAENYHQYDPARGEPVAWIYWMARAAVKTSDRKNRGVYLSDVEHASGSEDMSSFERRVDFKKLMEVASGAQREAIDSYLSELSEPQIRAQLGVGVHARNLRLRDFVQEASAVCGG